MGRPIRQRLEFELFHLGEQRRRYLVAIEVAERPDMVRRRIRTVRRLEEEIAARKEVLRELDARTMDQ